MRKDRARWRAALYNGKCLRDGCDKIPRCDTAEESLGVRVVGVVRRERSQLL